MGEKEKEMLMAASDKLGIVAALVKTANLAIGNMEYFGQDGQGIAISLDVADRELRKCRKVLALLGKDKEGGR